MPAGTPAGNSFSGTSFSGTSFSENDPPPPFDDYSDEDSQDEAPPPQFPKDSEGDILTRFLTEFELFELSLEDDRSDFLQAFSQDDEQADLNAMVQAIDKKAVDSTAPTRFSRLLSYLHCIPEDGHLSSKMWDEINGAIGEFVRHPLTLNRSARVEQLEGGMNDVAFTMPKQIIQKEVRKLDKLLYGANSARKELKKKDKELDSIRELYNETKLNVTNELRQKSLQLSKAEKEITEKGKKWEAEKLLLRSQVQAAEQAKNFVLQQSTDSLQIKKQVVTLLPRAHTHKYTNTHTHTHTCTPRSRLFVVVVFCLLFFFF